MINGYTNIMFSGASRLTSTKNASVIRIARAAAQPQSTEDNPKTATDMLRPSRRMVEISATGKVCLASNRSFSEASSWSCVIEVWCVCVVGAERKITRPPLVLAWSTVEKGGDAMSGILINQIGLAR